MEEAKTAEETKVKRLRNGQTAFIVWPGLNIKDIYRGEYNFEEPFIVVEVKICSRSSKGLKESFTFVPHYHYKVCFTCKEDRDRLIGRIEGDSENWDRAFEYEEASIGETPGEALQNAYDEIEPMVLGYAGMLDRLRALIALAQIA